jgi:hypothetical protein
VTLTPPVVRRDRPARLPRHRRVEGGGGPPRVRRGAEPGDAGEPGPRRRDDRDPRRRRCVEAR